MTAPLHKAISPLRQWRPLNQCAFAWGGDKEIVLTEEEYVPKGRLVRLSSYSSVPALDAESALA